MQGLRRDIDVGIIKGAVPMFSQNWFPVGRSPMARCTGIDMRSDRLRGPKAKENDKEKEEGERKADCEEIRKKKFFDSYSPARLSGYLRFGVCRWKDGLRQASTPGSPNVGRKGHGSLSHELRWRLLKSCDCEKGSFL